MLNKSMQLKTSLRQRYYIDSSSSYTKKMNNSTMNVALLCHYNPIRNSIRVVMCETKFDFYSGNNNDIALV